MIPFRRIVYIKFKDSARLKKKKNKEKRRNIRSGEEGKEKRNYIKATPPRKGKKFDPRMEYDSSRYFFLGEIPEDVFLPSQKFFLRDGVWSRKPRPPLPPPLPRNRVDMQMHATRPLSANSFRVLHPQNTISRKLRKLGILRFIPRKLCLPRGFTPSLKLFTLDCYIHARC